MDLRQDLAPGDRELWRNDECSGYWLGKGSEICSHRDRLFDFNLEGDVGYVRHPEFERGPGESYTGKTSFGTEVLVLSQPPHRAAEVVSSAALVEGIPVSDAVRTAGLAVVSGCSALWLLSLDLRHQPISVTGFNALAQELAAQDRLRTSRNSCKYTRESVCPCQPRLLTDRLLGGNVLVRRAGVLCARRERGGPAQA